MTPYINLLPWRKQCRQRQLRYWILFAAGCVLLVMLAGIARPALTAWQEDKQRIRAEYLSQLRSSLQRKYQEAQMLDKRQKLQERRKAQRLAVSRWEPRFIQLASLLPASVWLTSLSMKNGQVVIHGHAQKAADIRLLEQNLRQLPGAVDLEAKGIQGKTNSPLAFTFTFKSTEAGHAE
ncbi:PilN domain-containing protein [Enterobacteriaceae bacterium H20N1]|uniref:PilN domain-containing protein n=1 Tax=Dryocola boscaweniae TaxID=2925397 RepID=A0A9X3AP11_9ENTR|nr:PilN domain-containing protein [Dryocola boscaweniae]MCT4703462.1 PilN domain-containing protein [Dryocola boscaweniae]MCT4720630.1 PilN domain-containing protein [Dryocola boscaweniae]